MAVKMTGDARAIVTACKQAGLSLKQAAYVLASAWHESAHTMKPVRETLAKTDAGAKAALTKAWKAGKLKGVTRDYWSGGFYGRGHVQITHRENYAKASEVVGVDLVTNPDRMMETAISIAVMLDGMVNGWFRKGHTLERYINPMKTDYRGARNIINGDVKRNGQKIADDAVQFAMILSRDGYSATGKAQDAPKGETDVQTIALTKGDTGPAVVTLQTNLTLLGHTTPITGYFDDETDKTVRAFQNANDLKVDGAAGVNTNTKIGELLKAREVKPKLTAAKKVVTEAAAPGKTISTTEVAAGIAGLGGVSTAADKAKEAIDSTSSLYDSLISLGPWVIAGLAVAGAAAYIFWDRRRKRLEAREAVEVIEQ